LSHPSRATLASWSVLAFITLVVALPQIERPGLYYDEAFLAQQARDFAEPARIGSHAPSTRSVWILGRSYPLRNAAYLGSLKSQLTIPSLALFGASPRVLRTTTLVFGLLGLLLGMLWAQRIFGAQVATIAGLLIATDPSFYFLSQFEWGPFTTGLLCRSGGFLLLTVGWKRDRSGLFLLAGLVLGLGVYSRVDFAVILAAAGLALLLFHPHLVRELAGARRRQALMGLLGFALTATTTLLAARNIFTTSSGIAERGGVFYKAQVLWSVLDGSHFRRLMEVGGLFDRMFQMPSGGGVMGAALVACALLLTVKMARGWRHRSLDDPIPFLLGTTLLITAAMLAMPGAVRAHHMLNLMPFAHLVIACALADTWRAPASEDWVPRRHLRRAMVALVIAAIIGGNLAVIVGTNAEIQATGGRGRWSDALQDFASQVDASGESVVVSLDWGFHEPLQFTTERTRLLEPIWLIPHSLRQGRPWVHAGDERHTYLVHEAPYDLFGLSDDFLRTVRELGPERARVEVHRDRSGEPAFVSVRIPRRHRVIYTGEFTIELR
jgi:hypothetical protein